jgi:hypothetical protein
VLASAAITTSSTDGIDARDMVLDKTHTDPPGKIGCAFYKFGLKGSMDSHPYLIDVVWHYLLMMVKHFLNA